MSSGCFVVCLSAFEVSATKSVDSDQTAPEGAVRSGSTLFAFILTLVNKVSKHNQPSLKTSNFQTHFLS